MSFVQWLISHWIIERLKSSIEHEYNEKIEKLKFEYQKKEKAELIARLFARWIKYQGHEQDILDKQQLIDYYEDLNRMSLEISIWVPDDVLISCIMSRLQNSPGSKDVRAIIGDVRKYIQGDDKSFKPEDIILWPDPKAQSKVFLFSKI
jgi:hypothetical protein